MKSSISRVLYSLLFFYIAVTLTYQIVAAVSLVVSYFDLKNQVQMPFQMDFEEPVISSGTPPSKEMRLAAGDRIVSINGIRYRGRASLQRTIWHAHPGDVLRVGVLRSDGTHATVPVPLTKYSKGAHVAESAFLIFFHVLVPLFCLVLGYWVVLARPKDPNAWFLLILFSYPEMFVSVPTYDWLPGIWLALRLQTHLILEILAPVALLWLGFLFPERSRIDTRLPWLKWLVLAASVCGLGVALVTDYSVWYDIGLISKRRAIDAVNDKFLNWTFAVCIVVYWIAIFDKLRTASSADAMRRMRVLCIGSVVGLGSMLVIWGALPWLGIADPGSIQWLDYLSAILMLIFPLSLAYVVLVQRAMDVRILLRIGTKYALARGTIWVGRGVLLMVLLLFLWQTVRAPHAPAVALIRITIFGLLSFLVSPSVFGPLSNWIDRKFFREAYDAELVLSELSGQVRHFTETGPLIETVCRRISDVLHVPEIGVLLRGSGSFQLRYAIGLSSSRPLLLPEKSSAVEYVQQTNRPAVLSGDRPGEWFLEADDEEKRTLAEMQAELLLALPGRDRLMGIMALGRKKSEEAYTPSDLRVLQSVGVQTGLALEVSELAHSLAAEAAQRARIDREIEIAREVQERLFPQHLPALPGLSLAGFCRPAQGIGGDYYDVIEFEDGRLGLAIGDVSGKGISAALLMAALRSCLRTMTVVAEMDLAKMMQRMNQLVYDSSATNRYATFFFAVYAPATRKLHYVNAGHNPPVLIREPATGSMKVVRLETGGTVVGLLPGVVYEQGVLSLQAGDLLLAYTDGISEAMTKDEEEWGEERMICAAASARAECAQDILRAVFDAADEFTGSAPQHDDMTVLVMKLD